MTKTENRPGAAAGDDAFFPTQARTLIEREVASMLAERVSVTLPALRDRLLRSGGDAIEPSEGESHVVVDAKCELGSVARKGVAFHSGSDRQVFVFNPFAEANEHKHD